MIPYVAISTIPVGPLHIQVWGLFVALGIAVATWLAGRVAEKGGLKASVMVDLATWFILPALIGSRLAYVLFYDPAPFLSDPLAVLRVWEGGASSFGGFLGALLGGWAYFRMHDDVRTHARAYVEAAAFALPLGYGIGRIGCFLIHDHPGTLSDAFFAVGFPGGARLDHGLLLSLTGLAILAVFLVLQRKKGTHGATRFFYLPRLLIMYGGARFILDFWRATDIPMADARYFGLTPAQYGSLAMLAIGAAMLYHGRMTRSAAADRSPHSA
jgi:phosphatidylglycerol:prolipoprotein diacylglycerol transferase